MRLLVSVRSAAEVDAAVAGGAEIVDAKEPSRGSLGAVSPAALRAIAGALPPGTPLSVALGDPADARAVAQAVASLDGLVPRAGETFVKLGLAWVEGIDRAEELVAAAVAAASRSPVLPEVVVVAYADHAVVGGPSRDRVIELAARAGARGVLLDTGIKDGRDLFDHVDPPGLRRWILAAQRSGLLAAVAGSLTEEGVRRLADQPADVAGVRGAACSGGRDGVVVEDRVRRLRLAVDRVNRPSVAAT
jgi:uncharacterized protein (UPF0264 family)